MGEYRRALNAERAMIVYLDSQDYSHLAAPPRGKEEFFASLSTALKKLVDRGDIEIRYSAIHISEMAHVTATAMKFSVPRTEILKEFCRGKCMRYWQFVAEEEVLSNFKSAEIIATNDNDQWFETDMAAIGDLADHFKKELQGTLQQRGANRKMRRRANAFNVGRYLTDTKHGKILIENLVQSLNERFSLAKPISVQVMREYASGSVGTKKFQDHVRGLMFDPVVLMAQLTPEFDTEGKLPRIVRDQGKDFIEKLNPNLEKIAAIVPTFSRGPGSEPLWEKIHSFPSELTLSMRRSLVRNMIAKQESKAGQSDFDDATLDDLDAPIASTLTGAMGCFVKQALSSAEAKKPMRLLKMSDAPDLLHAAHIPHVDIFRCDTAWTDILMPEGRKYRTEIVGRIEDLIPTIERRLSR